MSDAIAGRQASLEEMLSYFDSFDFWFDIVTPQSRSGKRRDRMVLLQVQALDDRPLRNVTAGDSA